MTAGLHHLTIGVVLLGCLVASNGRHIRDALQLTRTDRIEAAVWAALPEERWVEEHRLCAAALGVGRAA